MDILSYQFFYSQRADGKFNICGRAAFREGNAPGSGSIFVLGWADTAAAARYDVECRLGRKKYSLAEFSALNRGERGE